MMEYAKTHDTLIEQNLVNDYDRYYRLAYSFVKNESDAMDIVQEAAYKAIYKSKTLKRPEYARNWIYRIVMNEAHDLLRRRKKEILSFEEPGQICTDLYDAIALQQEIGQLREEEQAVIYLRYYEEKQLDEIALITCENLNTVKSRLYRAMNKLKLALAN